MSGPYNPYTPPGGYPPPQGYQPQGYPPQGYQSQGYQSQGYQSQGYPPPGYPPQRGYLQGGPVNFQSAIRLQFENVTNFNGRASLSAYWWYALALFIVGIVLEIFSIAVGSAALTILIALVSIAIGLSGLSVGVRRLHDSDKSGWLLLLGVIPFVGAIILIVLLVLPGTPSPNRYG
jgi:uncharacterized membrane protein YhaH (DUF805 family)